MANIDYENQRILDVVNEKDKVIGSIKRTDVHRLGLLHREVHVWMFDEDLNIIFQKRGLHRQTAGLLDATVGGHVDKGENYLAAAIRETKEETGISVSSSDLIFLKKLRGKPDPSLGTQGNFIRYIYIYKKPVGYKKIKKEVGIPGGGFQKLSLNFLANSNKDDMRVFIPFVFTKEIPEVLKYINDNS